MAADEDSNTLSLLLRAARQGNKGALSQLLGGLWPWLRWKAGSMVSRAAPIGVSSLTQETALRFSRKLDKVRAADAPAVKALLQRIMQNTAYDAHRAAVRTKRDPSRHTDAELSDEAGTDVASKLEQKERLQRLQAAILRLPDRQRQAIQLLLEDLSIDDIAKHLQCSAGAVQMLIQRAKSQLAESLAESDAEATR